MGSFFSQGRVVYRDIVVECKGCHRHVFAGVETLPKDAIVVECSLCKEVRRYRAAEVYLGRADMLAQRKPPQSEVAKHRQYRREK